MISKTSDNLRRNFFRIFIPFDVSNRNLLMKSVNDEKYTKPSDDRKAPLCNDIRSNGEYVIKLNNAVDIAPIENASEK